MEPPHSADAGERRLVAMHDKRFAALDDDGIGPVAEPLLLAGRVGGEFFCCSVDQEQADLILPPSAQE
jgi:hypothetical protein